MMETSTIYVVVGSFFSVGTLIIFIKYVISTNRYMYIDRITNICFILQLH